jgi:peptidoglycan hydrolase-like protein with peptidoglycan-binding domain
MIDSWKYWYNAIIVATDSDWQEAQRRREEINLALKTHPATPETPHATPTAFAPTTPKPGDGFSLSTKDATIALQKVLGVTQDGAFGPQTDAKVREWQKSHNLKVDGIVGPLTWKSLGYQNAMPQLRMTGAAPSPAPAPSTPNKPGIKPAPGKPTPAPTKPGQAAVVSPGFFGWLGSLPWYVKLLGIGAIGFGGYKSYEIHKQNKKFAPKF